MPLQAALSPEIDSSLMSLLVSNYCRECRNLMLIQGREEIISLLCKGAGHKKQWPWVIVGQIMGTLLYRALYFMTKQCYFVSGTAFTLVVKSWPENLKPLLEEPYHLSIREADRMCRGEDAYSGNEEATGQVYVYSVSTQGPPHSLGRVPTWGTTAVTEEVKDNQTPWFLWTDCIEQPSLTCQGLPLLLLEHRITSDVRLAWLPSRYRLVDTSLPLSWKTVTPNFCAWQPFFLWPVRSRNCQTFWI